MKNIYFFSLLTLFLCFSSKAQLVTIDGNPADWQNPALTSLSSFTHVLDQFNLANNDNTFTSVPRDYMTAANLRWDKTGCASKYDLGNGCAVLLPSDGTGGPYLCFCGDRRANNGDLIAGYWFYLNGTAPRENPAGSGTGDFYPEHTVGDLFVRCDYMSGGAYTVVTVYKWVGSGGNSGFDAIDILTAPTAVVASSNTTTYPVPSGWSYPTTSYPIAAFYEGKIDLGQLQTQIPSFCFTSFLYESRASSSFSSRLYDLLSGQINTTPQAPLTQGDSRCGPGVVNLSASGMGTIKWYMNSALTEPPVATGNTFSPTLSATTTYWVTAAIPNCTSIAATVTGEIVSKKLNIASLFLEGLYCGGATQIPANNENGLQFLPDTADLITVELHSSVPGNYPLIEYSAAAALKTNGTVSFDVPCGKTGEYYVTVKHRNCIETVSSAPVNFTGSTTNYSFNSPLKAYGNNMAVMIDGTAVIYSGDENQDGIIDGGDLSDIENMANLAAIGYVPQDLNGDGLVDGTDLSMAGNNATLAIGAMTP
jgi:hypothetical protein